MPAQQVLTLHYEDFLTDVVPTANRLITFIDPTLANDDWLAKIQGFIHPARSSWKSLPKQEQAFLQAACEPGFQKLRDFEIRKRHFNHEFT